MKGKTLMIGHASNSLFTEIAKQQVTLMDDDSYIEYKSIQPLPEFIEKLKPTCQKHHEYVQQVVDKKKGAGGTILKSIWQCRFCGKQL